MAGAIVPMPHATITPILSSRSNESFTVSSVAFVVEFFQFAEWPPPRSGLRPMVYRNGGTYRPDWRGVGIWRWGTTGSTGW